MKLLTVVETRWSRVQIPSGPIRGKMKEINIKEIKITEHMLVPKHNLLSEEDGKKIFEKYNINANQLPGISRKDPAIANLDFKTGDIIKITRKSATAKNAVFYRIIADD